jgi:hypothetical protein
MSWDEDAFAALNELLATLYPYDDDVRRIATRVDIRSTHLVLQGKAINSWFALLYPVREDDGKIRQIIAVALEEHPGDERLEQGLRPS